MRYKIWEFDELRVDNSLTLSGRAESNGDGFVFRVDLVTTVAQQDRISVTCVKGISHEFARRVTADFVMDRLYGAALSAIGSARDRLNDFSSPTSWVARGRGDERGGALPLPALRRSAGLRGPRDRRARRPRFVGPVRPGRFGGLLREVHVPHLQGGARHHVGLGRDVAALLAAGRRRKCYDSSVAAFRGVDRNEIQRHFKHCGAAVRLCRIRPCRGKDPI